MGTMNSLSAISSGIPGKSSRRWASFSVVKTEAVGFLRRAIWILVMSDQRYLWWSGKPKRYSIL